MLILNFRSLIFSHRFKFLYGQLFVQLILRYGLNPDDRLRAVVEVIIRLVIVLSEMIDHRIFFFFRSQ